MRWLALVCFASLLGWASAVVYSEDFYTDTYKSPSTSARWDTCTGNVSLTIDSNVSNWSITGVFPLAFAADPAKNRLYGWNTDGLDLYNTVNPYMPTLISTTYNCAPGPHQHSPGAAAYASNFLYLAAKEVDDVNTYLNALNVTTDTSFRKPGNSCSSYFFGDPPRLNFTSYLYVSTADATKLRISGNYLYLSTCGGGAASGLVHVYNITKPQTPVLNATLTVSSGDCVTDINVSNNRLYAVGNYSKLKVYNVTNVTNISLLGETNLGFEGLSLQVVGTTAFVIGNTSFASFDAANPSSITKLSNITCSVSGNYSNNFLSLLQVLPSGTFFFRPNQNSDGWSNPATVTVFNVSNAASLRYYGDLRFYTTATLRWRAFYAYDPQVMFAGFDDPYSIPDRLAVFNFSAVPRYRIEYNHIALSNNVTPATTWVGWATLNVTNDTPPSTRIDYYLSNDQATLLPWPSNGTRKAFPTQLQGFLRWDADLFSTNNQVTPVLDNLTIEYGSCNTTAECSSLNNPSFCNGSTLESRTYTVDPATCACVLDTAVPYACTASKSANCGGVWSFPKCALDSDCANQYPDQCQGRTWRDYNPPLGGPSSGTCDTAPYTCSCLPPAYTEYCIQNQCGATCEENSFCEGIYGPEAVCTYGCTCLPGGSISNLGPVAIANNATGFQGQTLVLTSGSYDADGGPLTYQWFNRTSLQDCVEDVVWGRNRPTLRIWCSTVGNRTYALQVEDNDAPVSLIDTANATAIFLASSEISYPSPTPYVSPTPEPGGGSTVLFDCPRLSYTDVTQVSVQCLEGGVACSSNEITFSGGTVRLLQQTNHLFVYELESSVAKDHEVTVSHPRLGSATCRITRVNTAASASVPDFNWLLLPLVLLTVIVLLRIRRKKTG